MCARLTSLALFGVVLGAAGSVSAGLVAHWKLDDGSGTVASDSSGNGFDGTLINGPVWVAGTDGGALQFDGADDYVDFGNPAGWPAGRSPRSMCGWGKTDTIGSGYRWIAAYGSPSTSQAMFIGLNGSTLIAGGYGGDDVTVTNTWTVGEWYHVGLTYDGTTARAYLNGREIGSMAKNWNLVLSRAHIGRQVNNAAEFWDGAVDDVRIYDHVLTAAEMKALVPPKVKARKPSPADGAVGVFMPLFTWTPGETALFEDIYLGTSPELTAADRVAARQPAMLKMYYHMQPFIPGQTYYWRVDAVEAGGTVHTGDVWSFTVTPQTAWAPKPTDGAMYVDPAVELGWSAGLNATGHDVYFGTDRAAVEAGSADTFKGNRPVATYAPGALMRGATYYWRVDEVVSGAKVPGEVWSFTVRPVIPKADPDLVAWWKLEDESSGTAVDYSGGDFYGTLIGGPTWVEGYYGEALDFDGVDDYVDFGSPQGWPAGNAPRSMCGWGKTDTVAAGWKWIAAYGSPATSQAMFIGLNGTALYGGGYGDDVSMADFWEIDTWHHICLTYDGTTARLYADGVEVASAGKTWNLVLSRAHIGRQVNTLVEFWDGIVDDVRIYKVALTPEQIRAVMRGDPLLAWDPQPKSGANVDIRDAGSLQWSAGIGAAKHDVYFGTDRDAVKAATAASPEYAGRQAGMTFSVAGLVEFGGGSYFWRIDEVEADGATVHKGIVWEFTVPAYLIVDEFEGYTDEEGNRIYERWIDGWTNGTGSQVGYLQAPFAERTIVRSGRQSMPLDFNNTKSPFYSEAEYEFAPQQDWTTHGVDTLSLWVRGNPGRFSEDAGVFTIGASGHDIWDNADDFRFVYKRLNGNGSITAKVESLVNTNGWAKAGVMIREALTAGSRHGATVITPSNGVSFPYRLFPDDVSAQTNTTGVQAPRWVRITRTGDVFKAEYSANGTTWTAQGADQAILMTPTVYIGLCLTSHNTTATTTGVFSNVTTTGAVTGQWQQVWLGDDRDLTNGADTLYVALEDSAGKVAVESDPTLVNATAWTEWAIPLSDFAGVNLTRVKTVYIGVGDRANPTPGGSGCIYIDDITLRRP